MTRQHILMKGIAASAIMVAAFAVPGQLPASAQTTKTPESPPTAVPKKVPRTSATPEMIRDAIERSKSRTQRLKTLGIPEQFGSEDPAKFKVKK